MDDSVPHSDQTLDILFVTSDLYPPFRPAAKAVFAEGLAARGHRIDWLMQAAEPSNRGGAQAFKGGTAYVAPTNAGTGRLARLRRHLAAVRNDFKVFALLRRHRYSLVQIKDKYFGALVAIVAAIALTARRRADRRRQDPAAQVRVRREERVRLVSMRAEKDE